jgi:hypothetical protein
MIEPSFGKYSNSYETIDLKIYANTPWLMSGG